MRGEGRGRPLLGSRPSPARLADGVRTAAASPALPGPVLSAPPLVLPEQPALPGPPPPEWMTLRALPSLSAAPHSPAPPSVVGVTVGVTVGVIVGVIVDVIVDVIVGVTVGVIVGVIVDVIVDVIVGVTVVGFGVCGGTAGVAAPAAADCVCIVDGAGVTTCWVGNHWQSVAISGDQWQSVAISGDHWHSLAISGNQ